MRIDPKLKILSFLVVGAFLLSVCSATQALAAAKGSKSAGFKAAQTKAHKVLTNTANNSGGTQAQQSNTAANLSPVSFSVSPGLYGPVHKWFIPAQPSSGSQGQASVAGGGWRTPAAQGTSAPQQSTSAPQAPPATTGWSIPSICYYLPSWTTTNWWNAPATSGGSAVPAYTQPAQVGRVGVTPATVCYTGCVPGWGSPAYAGDTYCAPACY